MSTCTNENGWKLCFWVNSLDESGPKFISIRSAWMAGKGDVSSEFFMHDYSDIPPKFFSKSFILVISILISPFLGAILFAVNLNAIGKRKAIIIVILSSFIWVLLLSQTIRKLFNGEILGFIITPVIVNVLGGLILAYPVWNYYLKNVTRFESRKIGRVIIVIILGSIALTAYMTIMLARKFEP